MNFEITEDQLRKQQAARDFAERELASHAASVDREGNITEEALKQLRETGFLGLTLPNDHGGSGGDFVTLALVIEELAAACANTAAYVGTNVVAARALLAHGSESQKAELLTNVAQGATPATFAVMDLDNLGADVPTALRQEDGTFELRGETAPMTTFEQTEHSLVFGRTSDEDLTAFLVPNALKGWSRMVLPTPLGKRAAPLAVAHFAGLRVPEANAIGSIGGGLSVARSVLADARIVAAAEAIGIARAAYQRAVLHVKQVLPKSTEPGLLGWQVLIADMCVEIEAARLLTLRAASQADAEVSSGAERSMAKLFAAEMSSRVVHRAMQVLGARHIVMHPSLERHARDARTTELCNDSLEVQRAIIARTMLKA